MSFASFYTPENIRKPEVGKTLFEVKLLPEVLRIMIKVIDL